MPPLFLLCGDLNAKVGGLIEVTHACRALFVAHPAFQLARQCECQAINAAGRLFAGLAGSLDGSLGMGRLHGDNGQASFVGLPAQKGAGRPDHVLMSSAFFRLASVQISPLKHISDRCTMSLHFVVEDAGVLADWSPSAGRRYAPCGCGERSTLCWRLNRACLAALANSDFQGQFEQANAEKDLKKACCMLCSLVVHAAGEPGVDMTNHNFCLHSWRSQGAARGTPW